MMTSLDALSEQLLKEVMEGNLEDVQNLLHRGATIAASKGGNTNFENNY